MKRTFLLAAVGVLLAILAAYSNHFQNDFHFDDGHAVTRNPAIRKLANIPLFFVDASTFSTMRQGYMYRPVVTTSLAFDYWLGGGLKPFYFHLTTFIVYLAGLGVMCWLFFRVYQDALPHPWNSLLALFGAALFGLHPASAETVNYIVQRGDLYAAWGIVGSIAIYAGLPKWRRSGLYLIPAAIGILAKPTALVIGPMMLAYVLLAERGSQDGMFSRWKQAIPALALSVSGAILHKVMTPASFNPNAGSAADYWMTEPWVALRYFRSFFVPVYLSADTDLSAFTSLNFPAICGMLFIAVLVALGVLMARSLRWRPVSFGLWWFLIALLPTAIFPVQDVENDHRMFMPFVGLALAVVWTVRLVLLARMMDADTPPPRTAVALTGCAAIAVLAALGFGTHARNDVWRSDESLWHDVTLKSPGDLRGFINYGETQYLKGRYQTAYDYFERAAHIRRTAMVEAYLGNASAALGHDFEAEQHYRVGLSSMDNPMPYLWYGSWLERQGRWKDAFDNYQWAATFAPSDLQPRYGLMRVYRARMDFANLAKTAQETLQLAPGDPTAREFAEIARKPPDDVKAAEDHAAAKPTAENYLKLSYFYCQKGRPEDCVRAARQAIKLRPNYPEAYNNIAGAYGMMRKWDDAIAAAREALRLKPNHTGAAANLKKLELLKAAGP